MHTPDHMRGQLEAHEWDYALLTERDLIKSTPNENGDGVWRFDDDSEQITLTATVAYAKILTQFVINQLKQGK